MMDDYKNIIIITLSLIALTCVIVSCGLSKELKKNNEWIRNLDQTVNVIPTEVVCKVHCKCNWHIQAENTQVVNVPGKDPALVREELLEQLIRERKVICK